MLANQDTNIADAVVTIKKLSTEEYFRLCCEAQEDRIRCENDMRHYYENKIEECDNTIKEQDNTIKQQDNTIKQQDNTIKQQDNTIKQQDKQHKLELERLYKIIEARDKEILELKQKSRN